MDETTCTGRPLHAQYCMGCYRRIQYCTCETPRAFTPIAYDLEDDFGQASAPYAPAQTAEPPSE